MVGGSGVGVHVNAPEQVQVFNQWSGGLDGFFAPVVSKFVQHQFQPGLLYWLYRCIGRQGHCIGGLFPADEPVGNVYVSAQVFLAGVLLEIVADIHFQLGAGLDLLLPVVVGIHIREDQDLSSIQSLRRRRLLRLSSSPGAGAVEFVLVLRDGGTGEAGE